jgi:hypothetical protein
LEIDGVAGVHAVFDLGDGGVGVSVEELEIADAITGEEWAGHGAVESGVGVGLGCEHLLVG